MGSWESTDDFCIDNLFQIPWIINYGATRTNRCHIPIYYSLLDGTSEPTNIYCRYSLDNGNNWNWAWQAPGGSGVTNLAASPEGVVHTFMWDAARNLPEPTYSDVLFAILPYNTKGMGGFWKSAPFKVENSKAPWIALYTPQSSAPGDVIRVYMRIFDHQSLPTDVRGWYSMDGGITWNEATAAGGGNLLHNLATSPAGVLYHFPWDARADLGNGIFEDVRFAVMAENPNGTGDREETSQFIIGLPIAPEGQTPQRTQ